MRDSITFIHCADLHLDSPFKGIGAEANHVYETIKESTFQSLNKLVKEAVYHQVDFILMTGDIFDHPNPSLKAIMRFKQAMEKLAEKEIQVFLSYGNHDYNQAKEEIVSLPNNVHRFTSEKVARKPYVKNGVPLAYIYGFSYTNRAVTENKVPEYIRENEDGYHIGMLHGSISTNTDHEPYAPFQLSELTAKHFDYWALGHIHKREILQKAPPVIYSGNIQGRSRKETGERGCYLVKMDSHQTSWNFLSLQQVRFETEYLEVSEMKDLSDLERTIESKLASLQNKIGTSIIDMNLISSSIPLKKWEREGYLEDLKEMINEKFNEENNWMYIRKLKINEVTVWNIEELRNGQHFIGELIRNLESTGEMDQTLAALFRHKRARKFLTPLTTEEKDGLASEAVNEVLDLLLGEEEV